MSDHAEPAPERCANCGNAFVETSSATTRQELTAGAEGKADCSGLERRIASWVLRMEDDGPAGQPRAKERVNSRLLSIAPYAMFAMQPVFAGLVLAVYRCRHQTYGVLLLGMIVVIALGLAAR